VDINPETLEQALDNLRRDPRGYDPRQDPSIPPEERRALVPYIEQARRLLLTPRPQPPARAVHAARARMHQALTKRQRSNPLARLLTFLHRSLVPLTTAAVAIVVIVALGLGSYALALESLPGQPLYSYKRQIERVTLALTRTRRPHPRHVGPAPSGRVRGIEQARYSKRRPAGSVHARGPGGRRPGRGIATG